VLLAASAGGLAALRQVVGGLPADFPAAVIVVQHRTVDSPFLLPSLLARVTALTVTVAEPGVALRDGGVYVARPAPQLWVTPSRTFAAARDIISRHRGGRCTADGVLRSVAEVYGQRAIGVILTGLMDDGAQGVWRLKHAGGRVLVQDPHTAQCPEMPRAAMATGCVDFVLPLDQLAPAITALVMMPGAADHFQVPIASWAPQLEPPSRFGQLHSV
jgi:two-component system chemotaxis response regulator CheB